MFDIQSNAWEYFQSFGSFKFLLNLIIKFHLYLFPRERKKFYPGSSTTVKMSHVTVCFATKMDFAYYLKTMYVPK